eukprot:1251881-Pyramimonas_sp.AAC.1
MDMDFLSCFPPQLCLAFLSPFVSQPLPTSHIDFRLCSEIAELLPTQPGGHDGLCAEPEEGPPVRY